MSSRLSKTFRQRSVWSWNQIHEFYRLPSPLSETTLTECNLKSMKSRHRTEITTINFNQVMEGYLGGDWEWWLHGISGRWVGFRIQAKIIDPKSSNYYHLHYKNKSNEYQSDILLVSCRRFHVIPLYCLYTYWSASTMQPPFRCGTFKMHQKHFGCSLVRIEPILQLRRSGELMHITDLLPNMFPWHCLVSCPGYGGGDLADRAYNFWQRAMTPQNVGADFRNFDLGDPAPRSDPPGYVLTAKGKDLIKAPDEFLSSLTIIEESDIP